MIQRLSHTTLYVTDQDQAREFYAGKLGLEVRTDQTMGDFRWLTVGPKAQPELEIVLMKVGANPGADEQTAQQVRDLLQSGKLGAAGVFDTADCRKTFQELKERGVEFLQEPKDQFYGVEAVFRDPFGNRFSLTQPK
jgi:catechol 2,3-dioxygenase-like lactoylglutathione lyase family enzyme